MLLAIVGIGAIIGISLSVRAMADAITDARLTAADLLWTRVVKHGVLLCGWVTMAWIAYRGTQRNLAPPEWLVLVLAILIWVGVLL
jgi:hypothetical protein